MFNDVYQALGSLGYTLWSFADIWRDAWTLPMDVFVADKIGDIVEALTQNGWIADGVEQALLTVVNIVFAPFPGLTDISFATYLLTYGLVVIVTISLARFVLRFLDELIFFN